MFKKNSLLDVILALLIGVGGFLLMTIWSFDGLHPFVWKDVAIATGAIPKGQMLPGLGTFLGSLLFSVLPYGTALFVQGVVAKVLVAACGVMAYYAMQWMMGVVSGYGARDWRRRNLAIRLASAVAAVAFICSDPMWQAAQGLTGATFVIFLAVLLTFLFSLLLVTASVTVSVGTLFVGGLLAAESPIGWLMLILGVWATVRVAMNIKAEAWMRFLDPERMQHAKWRMTFTFIGALVGGMLAEMYAFASLGGMQATGVTTADLTTCYFKSYWILVVNSMDLLGFLALIVAVAVPFVIASVMLTSATDEDQFLSFKHSVVYFITALIAFLQLSPFDFAWFWQLLDEGSLSSEPMLLFAAFLSALTLGWGLYVLCVEVLCRDYKHIEEVLYQNDAEDGIEVRVGHENVTSVRLTFGRIAALALPVVLLAIVIPGRRLPDDRQLCSVIREFVDETVAECDGVRYLFTDGAYDNLIRLEAKRRGIDLIPVSLMGGAGVYDGFVRKLGTTDREDRLTLEAGGAEALRTWVLSKSDRMAGCAAQLAFEMFGLNPSLKPVVYGALVRPSGGDVKAAAESVERCRRMADRIGALQDSGVWRHAKNALLKDRFLFAQFRLAVMARLRAVRLDAEKDLEASAAELARADRLNAGNSSLAKIQRKVDWVRRQSGEMLTPREGLEVALKRADFAMARRYAMPVLREDPDEPNANFAMGMSLYCEEQFFKAEEFLKRVLKKRANESAVYNNLALVCLKTGRLEEAQKNVKRALELKPDSPEIQETRQQVQKTADAKRKPARP